MTSITVPVREIAARTLQHVPETFDPAWLRSTWSGPHGRLGLQSSINEVKSNLHLSEQSIKGKSGIAADIVLPDGKVVGELDRDVTLSPNGRLNVYHAYLKINSDVQKSGFASSFNQAAFDRYAAAGVDDVTVTAALSAGGYVWARTGFELATEGVTSESAAALVRASMVRDLVESAYFNHKLSDADIEHLLPRLLPSDDVLRPDTLTSVRELAAIDGIGERVLAGQAWSGIRLLDTPAPFATRGIGGAADAQLGVAHLRPADEVPAAMSDARGGVSALLPDAFSPTAFPEAIERATADLPIRLERAPDMSSTSIDLVQGQLAASSRFRVIGSDGERIGSYQLGRSVVDGRIHVSRGGAGGIPDSGQLNDRVREVLKDMGATRMAAISADGYRIGRSRPLQPVTQ